MQHLKMILIVVVVLFAAGATLALAYGLASVGAPTWQAALGPILLVAILVFRWYEARSVAAAKDAAKSD